jgi:hypothetical protein
MRVAALGLALTAPATLSHASAAIELGLEILDPDLSRLHVTRPLAASSRREAGVVHHAADLPEHHVVRREGLLDLTSPARTAIDVGRETDRLERAVAALDSALRLGVSRDELLDVFTRCRTWPGARMVSGALAMADGRAANPGESWSRVILIRLGLTPLDLQVRLADETDSSGMPTSAGETLSVSWTARGSTASVSRPTRRKPFGSSSARSAERTASEAWVWRWPGGSTRTISVPR